MNESCVWKCSHCTLENTKRKRRCDACGMRRDLEEGRPQSNENRSGRKRPRPGGNALENNARHVHVWLRLGSRKQPKGLVALIDPDRGSMQTIETSQNSSLDEAPPLLEILRKESSPLGAKVMTPSSVDRVPNPEESPQLLSLEHAETEEQGSCTPQGLSVPSKSSPAFFGVSHDLSPPSQESLSFRYTPPSQEEPGIPGKMTVAAAATNTEAPPNKMPGSVFHKVHSSPRPRLQTPQENTSHASTEVESPKGSPSENMASAFFQSVGTSPLQVSDAALLVTATSVLKQSESEETDHDISEGGQMQGMTVTNCGNIGDEHLLPQVAFQTAGSNPKIQVEEDRMQSPARLLQQSAARAFVEAPSLVGGTAKTVGQGCNEGREENLESRGVLNHLSIATVAFKSDGCKSQSEFGDACLLKAKDRPHWSNVNNIAVTGLVKESTKDAGKPTQNNKPMPISGTAGSSMEIEEIPINRPRHLLRQGGNVYVEVSPKPFGCVTAPQRSNNTNIVGRTTKSAKSVESDCILPFEFSDATDGEDVSRTLNKRRVSFVGIKSSPPIEGYEASMHSIDQLQSDETLNAHEGKEVVSTVVDTSIAVSRQVATFQTAGSRSQIKVDKASLRRAEDIFQQRERIDAVRRENSVSVSSTEETGTGRTTLPFPRASFQTAGSGSQIRVEEPSLRRARHLLEECDRGNTDATQRQSGETLNAHEGKEVVSTVVDTSIAVSRQVATFQTAGSRSQIKVDKASLRRAEDIFQQRERIGAVRRENSVSVSSTEETGTGRTTLPFPRASFQTAGSGSQIRVEEPSLRRARHLLEECDRGNTDATQLQSGETLNAHEGKEVVSTVVDTSIAVSRQVATFQTAGSRSQIKVDKASLRRVHHLLTKLPRASASPNVKNSNYFEEGNVFPSEKGDILHFSSQVATSSPAGYFSPILSDEDNRLPARGEEKTTASFQEGCFQKARPEFQMKGYQYQYEARLGRGRYVGTQQRITRTNTKPLSQPDCGSTIVVVKTAEENEGPPRLLNGNAYEASGSSINGVGSCSANAIDPHESSSGTWLDVKMGSRTAHARNYSFDDLSMMSIVTPRSILRKNCDELTTPMGRLYGRGTILDKQRHHQNRNAISATEKTPFAETKRTPYCPIGASTQGDDSSNGVPAVTPLRPVEPDDDLRTVGCLSVLQASSNEGITPKDNEASTISQRTRALTTSGSSADPGNKMTPIRLNLPSTQAEREENAEKCLLEGNQSQLSPDAIDKGVPVDLEEYPRKEIQEVTSQINSLNSVNVQFDMSTGLPVGFKSISSEMSGPTKHLGTVDDLKHNLVCRGCDIRKISDSWLLNHKRWVVWTLASYERSFSSLLGGRYLTYQRLIQKLQERYHKEITTGHRAATRMVLNRDAAASLPMILCVSQVVADEKEANIQGPVGTKLQVTDGWYHIDAELDPLLSKFVKEGIVRVGTKLLVSNAELRGADQGIDPLDSGYFDAPDNSTRPFLLLKANSTRLARWNSKLGFLKRNNSSGERFSVVKRISDILAGGGDIPAMKLLIMRRYPLLYLEKGPNAGNVPLSEAEEDKRRTDFERRRLQAIEKVSERVRKDVEKGIDENAPSIWKEHMAKEELENDCISDEDKEALRSWTEKRRFLLQRRVQEEIEAELEMDGSLLRQSTPFIRVKVHSLAATKAVDTLSETAMLTVWDPSEEQLNLLKEGSTIEVQDIAVRSALFDGLLQLTINGRTALRGAESRYTETLRSKFYQARRTFNMLQVHALSHTLRYQVTECKNQKCASTFDAAGILVCDLTVSKGEVPGFETYLTDESNLCLRVHFDNPPTELKRSSCERGWSIDSFERTARVIAFKDLQMLPFDAIMNCAVAKYTPLSTVSKDSLHQATLQEWIQETETKNSLLRVSGHVKALLPRSHSALSFSAVGYIVGARTTGGTALMVEVDCGTSVEEWTLPTGMLQAIREGLDDSLPTAFLESHESHLNEIQTIDFLFRARSVAWRFHVSAPSSNWTDVGCSFVVQNISKADPRSLALLHAVRYTASCAE